MKLSLSEFINLLCEKIDKIPPPPPPPTHLLQGLNQITWHILKKKLGLMRPLFRKTLLKTIHS